MLGILAGIDVGFWLDGTVCLAGCWESKSNNTRHQEWIWIKKISLSLSLSYKLKLGLKRIGSKFIIIKQCVVWMLVFLCESRNWDWLHISPRPASWFFFCSKRLLLGNVIKYQQLNRAGSISFVMVAWASLNYLENSFKQQQPF